MKVKELIKELLEFDMDADVTTSISEDICISYISKSTEDVEYTEKTTPQVFIEPTDNCPICDYNYMNEEEEVRWCDFYDKPCKDVEECYQSVDVSSSEYLADSYEGWIVKFRANNRE